MSADAPMLASTSELSLEAEAFVAAVGAATDLPAFVRNVRAISNVASNLDARVAQLEQAIMQDVALSAKVLRIANSVTIGATGGASPSVASVKQAIMLLGYDRVQHLSTAASVFEQLDQDAPSVRDLLVESVLAANHSLQLSMSAGYEKPELAYLCALFRRLGEVLVACYRLRPYRSWIQRLHDGGASHDGAEAAHFGFTFEEVGNALARKWGMPVAVVRTMHVSRHVTSSTDLLHAITQCSADIARGLYGAVPSTHEVADLRAHYAPAIGVDIQGMEESLSAALDDAKPTLSTMQVDLDQWLAGHAVAVDAARLLRERSANGVLVANDDNPHASTAGVALTAEDVEGAALASAKVRLAPQANDSAREAKLRETVHALIERRVADSASLDVGAVTSSALRAACDAGYERGVLGINSEDFKLIRGRVGHRPRRYRARTPVRGAPCVLLRPARRGAAAAQRSLRGDVRRRCEALRSRPAHQGSVAESFCAASPRRGGEAHRLPLFRQHDRNGRSLRHRARAHSRIARPTGRCLRTAPLRGRPSRLIACGRYLGVSADTGG